MLFPLEKQGIRVEGGKTYYFYPRLIFKEGNLNFAVVSTNGKRKIVPVVVTSKIVAFEGTPLEALLKIAQGKENRSPLESPISLLLKHPDNTLLSEKEVFEFLAPHICTLNAQSALDLLTLVKKNPHFLTLQMPCENPFYDDKGGQILTTLSSERVGHVAAASSS